MASSDAAPNSYVVKRVRFFSREVPVFLQNLNGPCPLLALANVLSLRNELRLPSANAREVPQDQLISLVAERLLEASAAFEGAAPELASDMRQNVSDSFEALSKLATGVDVNVRFTAIGAFEPTNEVAVFDLLGINLVHGWLVDPSDAATAAVFGSKSYNELVEMLFLTLGDEEAVRLSSMRSLPGVGRTGSAARYSHGGGGGSFGGSSSSAGTATAAAAAIAAAAGADAAAGTPMAAAADEEQQAVSAADAERGAASAGGGEAGATAEAPLPSVSAGQGEDASSATAAQQQQQQQQQPATTTSPAVTAAATTAESTTEAPAPAPAVPASSAADSQPAEAQPAVPAAPEGNEAAVEVIEGLLHDMVRGLSLEARPAAIALGESPTHSHAAGTHGAPGPSPLSQWSGPNIAAAAAPVHGADDSSAGVSDGMVTPVRAAAVGGSDLAQAHVVRDFLERHCSQLTDHGLSALLNGLRENQLAVFFRNNHFNTLFKYGDGVYLLVTDQGFASEPDIVWERLDSVNNTTFITSDFQPFVPHRPASYAGAVSGSSSAGGAAAGLGAGTEGAGDGSADADYALALQLQLQEEEEQQARERRAVQRQQQEEQAAASAAAAGRVGAPLPQGQRMQGATPGQRMQAGGSSAQQQQLQVQQQQAQQQAGQQTPQPLGRLGQGVKQQMEEAKEKCSIM